MTMVHSFAISLLILVSLDQLCAIILPHNINLSVKRQTEKLSIMKVEFDKAKLKLGQHFMKLQEILNEMLNGQSTNVDLTNQTNEDKIFIKAVAKDNKIAMDLVENLLNSKGGWIFVNEKDGVFVEKRFHKAGPFVSKEDASKGSKHAIVKSVGIIDATPQSVFELFEDNSRVTEYNEHVVYIKDVLYLSKPPPKANKKPCAWSKVCVLPNYKKFF